MIKFFGSFLIATAVVLVVFLSLFIVKGISSDEEVDQMVQKSLEIAYFNGQKAALEGDVRIEKTVSGYKWIKSPWEDGLQAIYNPEE